MQLHTDAAVAPKDEAGVPVEESAHGFPNWVIP